MDKLDIFLMFPEKDDDILNVVTGNIQDLTREIKNIKDILSNDFTLYYDSENIKSFTENVNFLNSDTNQYFDCLKNNLKRLIGVHSIDVKNKSLIKSDCQYIGWNIDDFLDKSLQPRLVKDATERKLYGDTVVLISFFDLIERDFLSIIKDAKHYSELPILVKIPYFNPISTFIEWYKRWKKDSLSSTFRLTNVERFSRTNFIYSRSGSKQRIYEEKDTKNYWYYDYFHKDNKEHYEVFDNTGNHIGEADSMGEMIPNSKDNSKNIKNYVK